jgi:hypothetical protein
MLQIKNHPASGIRFILLGLLIIFPYLVFSTNPSTYFLTGKILNSAGLPLQDIEILLYPCTDSFPGSPADRYITGSDGIYNLTAVTGYSYILELKGDLGDGRVFIPSSKSGGNPSARTDIIYPVTETVVILHTNDEHFTLNNQRELAEKISEIRGEYENVFLFSAGDILVRHPLRWIINGRFMRNPEWYGERALLMINSMNELGYDLMTPGNHELAYREMYTRRALDAADFPILAANMEITTDRLPRFKDYSILSTSTMRRLAVLGLTMGDAPDGVRVLDLSETVREHLSLKDSSDIFIALTHLGLRRDRTLAEEFPEFDLIIGGHSHDLLENALTVNSVLIAQAGGNPHIVSDSHPVYLGKIIIKIVNGKITEKTGHVLQIERDSIWSEIDP